MKLSIIIPAYNAEDVLPACLRSIYEQGADEGEFEVIVVDDGSTDQTAVATRPWQQHANLTVVSQTNSGVSAARNAALLCARGDYVTFADADDALGEGSLPHVLRHLSVSRPEIVVCQSFCGDVEHYPWHHAFDDGGTYDSVQLLHKGYIRGSVCGVLFRRSLIDRWQVRFLPGVRLGEDCQFSLEALAYADHVGFAAIPLYRVVGRPTSVSRVFTAQRIDRQVGDVRRIFDHVSHIAATVRHPSYLAYMRYIPVTCFVQHFILTPRVGLWHLLRSGLTADCRRAIRPDREVRFLARKMQLLRISLPLYYLIARIKYTLHS